MSMITAGGVTLNASAAMSAAKPVVPATRAAASASGAANFMAVLRIVQGVVSAV